MPWSIEAIPPAALEALNRRKSKYTAKSQDPVAELDTDTAIKRAIDYLKGPAPSAIAFEGGNDTTYRVASRVREFGISQELAFDLIGEHWNEAGKADPPWDAEELQTIIGNAYRYATGAWGGMSGLAEGFEPAEILKQPKEQSSIFWIGAKDAAATALDQINEPLVEGLLDLDAVSALYGASNSGKTFVELDIAFHIAAGIPWNGRETAKGLVAYVAAEGGRGILKRVKALMQKYKAEDIPLAIIPCPVNLLNSKADIKALVAAVQDAAKVYGQPIRWLVIDTLSRALAGGDEHGPTDMGIFIKNVDYLRKALECAVGIVHHTGKNEALGMRGWSGLRAAIDTEIEISKGVITVTKQRDLEPIAEMRFRLEKVSVGKNGKGRDVTTCVVRYLARNEFVKLELSENQKRAYAAFARALARVDSGIVGAGIWHDEMVADGELEKLSKRTRETLSAELAESGWVKIHKKGQYVALPSANPQMSAKES